MVLTRWTIRHDDSLHNVHTRVVPGSLDQSAELLDALPRPEGAWPRDRWWPLELSDGYEIGSRGGHGPVRYAVEAYEPGRSVTFRLADSMPFGGYHRFERAERATRVSWQHTLVVQDTTIARLVAVPLHDQLMEDLLDTVASRAAGETAVGEYPARPPLTRVQRAQRALSVRLSRRPLPPTTA